MITKANLSMRAVVAGVILVLLASRTAWCGSLPANDLVITGGEDATPAILDNTDIFDPATNGFSVGPAMAKARIFHAQVPLGSSFVLVAGGVGSGSTILSDAELLWRTTGTFSPTGSSEPN